MISAIRLDTYKEIPTRGTYRNRSQTLGNGSTGIKVKAANESPKSMCLFRRRRAAAKQPERSKMDQNGLNCISRLTEKLRYDARLLKIVQSI
jgi:hypothetical protein